VPQQTKVAFSKRSSEVFDWQSQPTATGLRLQAITIHDSTLDCTPVDVASSPYALLFLASRTSVQQQLEAAAEYGQPKPKYN